MVTMAAENLAQESIVAVMSRLVQTWNTPFSTSLLAMIMAPSS
jgi:hypothetical protein